MAQQTRSGFVAVISGISGAERYLKGCEETADRKAAQRFRSERAAETAAQGHIRAYPDVIQRHMTARVEPARAT